MENQLQLEPQTNEETKNLQIFVVYHQIVDEDILFTKYSEEYIKKTFAFYCVNEVIEKYETPKRYGLPIIYEYELPKYNPFLQLRHYMETSAYLHIYNNNIHKDLDFIGICQYDMLHVEEYKNLQKDRVYILDSGEPIALNGVWNKKMFPNEYQLNGDDNFSIIINNTEDDFLNSVRNIESCEDISLLFTVIITLIGLIGHFLTIFVFSQKRFR
jgi:hypothetical protein